MTVLRLLDNVCCNETSTCGNYREWDLIPDAHLSFNLFSMTKDVSKTFVLGGNILKI